MRDFVKENIKRRGKKLKEKSTWRPAREEREVGFFLSLSLLLAAEAAEFLPVIKPFAPFPDIFPPTPFNRFEGFLGY